MSERIRLAEHFINDHGQSAARALEEMPADIAGNLIDTISDPLSLSALTAMLPYHAAKCLAALPADAGAKYLAALGPGEAAAILRHLDEPDRKNLIDLLPRRQAVRVALLLGYPQLLVGAWMEPLTLSLPVTSIVADAKKRIANEGYDHDTVFIVDAGNKLRGSVSLAHLLLRAGEDLSLSAIKKDVAGVLHASLTLERAFDDPGWAGNDVLPVLDRSERFIGVLRYAELRRALSKPSLTARRTDGGDNLLGITEACYLGLADLMAMTLGDDHDATESA